MLASTANRYLFINTLLLTCPLLPVETVRENRLNYIDSVDSYLNSCPLGVHHKALPSPEPGLSHLCSEWADRSCCTAETMKKLERGMLYNFDHSHCNKTMSKKCQSMFLLDSCIYECSPNMGPWLVRLERKIGSERMFSAPLCMSDCDEWWQACRLEMTCVENWSYEFEWHKGRNTCPAETTCRAFEEVYKNATHFCHAVWDGSWVATNSPHCMHFLPGKVPSILEHNRAIATAQAEYILKQLKRARSAASHFTGGESWSLPVYIVIVSSWSRLTQILVSFAS